MLHISNSYLDAGETSDQYIKSGWAKTIVEYFIDNFKESPHNLKKNHFSIVNDIQLDIPESDLSLHFYKSSPLSYNLKVFYMGNVIFYNYKVWIFTKNFKHLGEIKKYFKMFTSDISSYPNIPQPIKEIISNKNKSEIYKVI